MLEIGMAMFLMVFLKAFQQRNVTGDHYLPVIPVSFGMAFAECFIIVKIATSPTLLAAIPMGIGGASGALLAMYLHRRLFPHK